MDVFHAQGTDLRPARNTDLVSLIEAQSRRNTDLARRLTGLRKEVDGLAAQADEQSDTGPEMGLETQRVGLTPVSGPGITVTLDDAPSSVAANGIEPDLLVVHQQDIQAVVNALWVGGAEAMTIQNQRVISTTAVKCVGNTVVLHGIPYSPPYHISAIGDPEQLRKAVAASDPIRIYKQYVKAYGLGFDETSESKLTFEAHVPGRLIALRRVLGQCLHNDRVDLRTDLGVQLARWYRSLTYVLVGNADRRVPNERRPANKQLIQQTAGGVQVASGIDGLAAGLFGR